MPSLWGWLLQELLEEGRGLIKQSDHDQFSSFTVGLRHQSEARSGSDFKHCNLLCMPVSTTAFYHMLTLFLSAADTNMCLTGRRLSRRKDVRMGGTGPDWHVGGVLELMCPVSLTGGYLHRSPLKLIKPL